MITYTFVCLAQNEAATAVDIQVMGPEAVRGHALSLLREHASATSVEVWRDDRVIAIIDRGGVRASTGRDGASSGPLDA
jgi:hypothetical protein